MIGLKYDTVIIYYSTKHYIGFQAKVYLFIKRQNIIVQI